MPPKRTPFSQQSNLASSQDRSEAALRQLNNFLQKAVTNSSQNREIRVTVNIRKSLSGVLEFARKGLTIPVASVALIASRLQDGGHEFCSRFSGELYHLILQILLYTEYSREGERGLNILAASLYHDTVSHGQHIVARKQIIGTACLQFLLEYFTNRSKPDGMRRWVGLLYIQLLQGCQGNFQILELGQEDLRRKLGSLVLQEKNEIIRLICGNLIRDMLEAGIPHENLWPRDTDRSLYVSFPQSGENWKFRFQEYIDTIGELISPGTEIFGQLYFAMNVTTNPKHEFGTVGHNLVVALESDQITILAPAITGTEGKKAGGEDTEKFDQVLELPLDTLTCMGTYPSTQPSQNEICNVRLDFDGNEDKIIYIDAVPQQLTHMTMLMVTEVAREMEEMIKSLNPAMDILQGFELGFEDAASQEYQTLQASQTSQHISYSEEPLRFERTKESEEVLLAMSRQEGKLVAQISNLDLIPDTQDKAGITNKLLPPSGSSKVLSDTQRTSEALSEKSSSTLITANAPLELNTNDKIVGSLVIKSKAKVPLMKSLRLSGGGNSSLSQETSLENQSRKATREQLAGEGNEARSSQMETEQDIDVLRQRFPLSSEPTLRGALVAAQGSVEEAAKLLSGSSPRTTRSENNSRLKECFASESITSPEPQDASSLKKVCIGEKKQADAIPKLLATKTRSQQLNRGVAATNKESPTQSKAKPLPYLPKTTTDSPMYEIPMNGDAQNAVSQRQMNKAEKKSKTALTDTHKISKFAHNGIESGVKYRTEAVKHESALPALEGSERTLRSQRTVAAKASQRPSKSSGGEYEDIAELSNDPRKSKKHHNGTTHQTAMLPRKNTQPEENVQNDANANQRAVTRNKILRHSEEDQEPDPEIDDLYDATPKMAKNKAPIEPARKRKAKSLGEFASRLSNILEVSLTQNMGHSNAPPLELPPQIERAATHQPLDKELMTQESSIANSALGEIKKQIRSPNKRIAYSPNNGELLDAQRIEPVYADIDELTTQIFVRCGKGHEPGTTNNVAAQVGKGITTDIRNVIRSKDEASAHQITKHRAVSDVRTPAKRQGPNKINPTMRIPHSSHSPLSKLRVIDKRTRARKDVSRENIKSSPSPRRASPQIAALKAQASTMMELSTSRKDLVDDRHARKQPIISFGAHGAKNQGPSHVIKGAESGTGHARLATIGSTQALESSERKRKRKQKDPEEFGPLKKQKSASPPDVGFSGMDDSQRPTSPPENAWPESPTSSPNDPQGPLEEPRRSSALSIKYSQLSHVDKNGSPIAASHIDHFRTDRLRLLQTSLAESPLVAPSRSPSPRAPLFGPKVSLSGIRKARPSSPATGGSQYVPYRRTVGGLYEDADTKEVIDPDKALPDPFVDNQVRGSSGFASRLVADSPNTSNISNQMKRKKLPLIPFRNTLRELQLDAKAASQQVKPTGKSNDGAGVENHTLKKSLKVAIPTTKNSSVLKNHISVTKPPSEMTTATSETGSESAESPGSQYLEGWGIALRPHYENVSNAIHHIADEMVIRLAKEEDVTGLVVNQYTAEGNKILDHHIKGRQGQKSDMQEATNGQKLALIGICTETREFAKKSKDDMATSPVAAFEKQWKHEQELTQKNITQNQRKVV